MLNTSKKENITKKIHCAKDFKNEFIKGKNLKKV
jgi:hypothetical protein